MFCPNCSQQQISEEMRYCSRCGFPLEGVKELIASGGAFVKQATDSEIDQRANAWRKVRKAVWLMLAAFPMLMIVGILSSIDDGFAVLALAPLLCFIFGFVRLIYLTFKESRRLRQADATATPLQPATALRNPELPPARVTPIENFTGHRIETSEMVRPPSVTENTTKLLDDERTSHRS